MPAVVGVPETVPPEEIEVPGGRPVPVQVYPPDPPDAVTVNGVIAEPTVPDLFPGLFTVTPLLAEQVGSAACAGTP